MAQCLLHHGWLVLLKTGACCGLPIFFEVTTNWRAGCQKLACPVRREGRPESSSLPLSLSSHRHRLIRSSNPGASSLKRGLYDRATAPIQDYPSLIGTRRDGSGPKVLAKPEKFGGNLPSAYKWIQPGSALLRSIWQKRKIDDLCPTTMTTLTTNDRTPLRIVAAIIAISAIASLFLCWLVYYHAPADVTGTHLLFLPALN